MLTGKTYEDIKANFRWEIPTHFNIAEAICDRHVGDAKVALLFEGPDGGIEQLTFEQLQENSCRLANALIAQGVQKGDRIGILLPQCPETIIAHLATYRIGAIALPLFMLFGPEAIEYRLNDSAVRVVISNGEGMGKVLDVLGDLDNEPLLIGTQTSTSENLLNWQELIDGGLPAHICENTLAEDSAIIVYTSGTTGNPKGVLYAHRTLLGHLPGIALSHDFFPQPGDRMWTPADWAWAGGLMDVLLPSLYHGIPVVAKRFKKFDPQEAFSLLDRFQVRNAFIPPTALRMMRQVSDPKSKYDFSMRSIASGGERLREEMLDWGRETFGFTINEFYGQTEANVTISNCSVLMPLREGSMGRAVPGHVMEVVDGDGNPVPPGTSGQIAVKSPDPVFFLRYWKKPDATREKYLNGWLLTGDTGHRDEEGYFWFQARNDDVIISGGYRIGPAEIEDCLSRHPAVAAVAVVGVPDEIRGEVVKAFIVPGADVTVNAALHEDIKAYVKSRLSAHEYPRAIEFKSELPMTITGKVRRKDLRQQEARR